MVEKHKNKSRRRNQSYEWMLKTQGWKQYMAEVFVTSPVPKAIMMEGKAVKDGPILVVNDKVVAPEGSELVPQGSGSFQDEIFKDFQFAAKIAFIEDNPLILNIPPAIDKCYSEENYRIEHEHEVICVESDSDVSAHHEKKKPTRIRRLKPPTEQEFNEASPAKKGMLFYHYKNNPNCTFLKHFLVLGKTKEVCNWCKIEMKHKNMKRH